MKKLIGKRIRDIGKGISGVYAIINLINGKVYVGSAARCLRGRWQTHKSELRRGTHHSKHLQAAWYKYGSKSFKFRVLELCDPEDCEICEQGWMDAYESYKPIYGYNRCPKAGIGFGFRHSEETKAHWSKVRTGRKQSAETVAKRVAKLTGQKRTPEFCARMSKIGKRREARIVRVQSKEARRRIALASAERWKDPKYKAKVSKRISRSLTGKKLTEEHKRNLSISHKGQYRSPETIAKWRKTMAKKRQNAMQ